MSRTFRALIRRTRNRSSVSTAVASSAEASTVPGRAISVSLDPRFTTGPK